MAQKDDLVGQPYRKYSLEYSTTLQDDVEA